MERIEDEVPSFTISDREHAAGALDEATIAAACAAFREAGAIRIHRAIPLDLHAELDAHYRRRYAKEIAGTTKEDRRPLFTVDVEGPFNRPAFYANPFVYPLVQRLLGQDCILGACSTVISFPGAPAQFTHRDSDSLYGDYTFDVPLPPYALTVLMPLVDADEETGSTEVWPQSHKEPSLEKVIARAPVHPLVPKGSVMMTDSRVVHRGAANRSANTARPLVYCSYHRHWFRDYGGYESRPPIAMSPLDFSKVPVEHRHLFAWRFDPYWKIRVRRQAERVARDLGAEGLLAGVQDAFRRLRR